jgi:hypothetical protein
MLDNAFSPAYNLFMQKDRLNVAHDRLQTRAAIIC